MEGALRVALAEIAPGLAVAARKEEVDVRCAVLGDGDSACSGNLRWSYARHRRATDSVVIRDEDASGVELAQGE